MRAGNVLGLGGTPDVRQKDFIRIVEVGNDDVEVRKVRLHFGGQLPVARKEGGQTAGLDGPGAIHEPSGHGELRDVRVAKHFEMDVGKLRANRSDGGQREDEITDGAAADDEDFGLSRRDDFNQ